MATGSYQCIAGSVIGDGDPKSEGHSSIGDVPVIPVIPVIMGQFCYFFRRNCAIACGSRAYMLRGFLRVAWRKWRPKLYIISLCHRNCHDVSSFLALMKIVAESQTKASERNLCQGCLVAIKTPTRTWKCTPCTMQMQGILVSDFQNVLLQTRQTNRNNKTRFTLQEIVPDSWRFRNVLVPDCFQVAVYKSGRIQYKTPQFGYISGDFESVN